VLNGSPLNRYQSHSIMSHRGTVARLSVRIDNHRALEFASRAVFPALNGCAAHPWRKRLTFHLKTGSLFGSTKVAEDPLFALITKWMMGQDGNVTDVPLSPVQLHSGTRQLEYPARSARGSEAKTPGWEARELASRFLPIIGSLPDADRAGPFPERMLWYAGCLCQH
jgi:hypothetical protein